MAVWQRPGAVGVFDVPPEVTELDLPHHSAAPRRPRSSVPGFRGAGSPQWDPDRPVDRLEAVEFLQRFHADHPAAGPVEPRLHEAMDEIESTGTYTHTTAELAYGAQLAWRNSGRCIGRLYWRSLRLRDRRQVAAPDDIFAELVTHLREATSAGKVRPTITVFAPARPGHPYPKIWNEQLIRYAGYATADGGLVGDPRYLEFTKVVTAMGWRGAGSPFDVLPVVVEAVDAAPRWYELPRDAILEVALEHPEYPWFAELGLRWHAVPAISHMRLTIGGVHYPCAPFNGWYLGTEVGARNFADPDRYDLLPLLADRLGLDTSGEATLWRDRALVEVNVAVLHSFDTAGVRMSDHHTESQRFMSHCEKEEDAGRLVPGDWTWLIPPMSPAATPVFHRYYDEVDLTPNFYLDPEAAERALRGAVTATAAG
jgi:nitric-oxide synthase